MNLSRIVDGLNEQKHEDEVILFYLCFTLLVKMTSVCFVSG